MSATIMYQPVKGVALSVGAPSAFLVALTRAFGEQPWTLTACDAARLDGLAAGLASDDQRRAAAELAEMALKYDEIRVWAEY